LFARRGAAPVAPVFSDENEESRDKNCRVEVVKQ
jgi:hypothetical protein